MGNLQIECYVRRCGGLVRAARAAGLSESSAHRYCAHRIAEEGLTEPRAIEVAAFWMGMKFDRDFLAGHPG